MSELKPVYATPSTANGETREIRRVYQVLAHELELLEKRTSELAVQLGPVANASEGPASPPEATGPEAYTELGQSLAGLAERVHSVRRYLENLMDRVQL